MSSTTTTTSGGEDDSSQPVASTSSAGISHSSHHSSGGGGSGGEWEVGQRVFCYHGKVMYEARVTVIEPHERSSGGDGSLRYMVHYHGWNKSWDEWVPGSRLARYNAANKEKAALTRRGIKGGAGGGRSAGGAERRGSGPMSGDNNDDHRSGGPGGPFSGIGGNRESGFQPRLNNNGQPRAKPGPKVGSRRSVTAGGVVGQRRRPAGPSEGGRAGRSGGRGRGGRIAGGGGRTPRRRPRGEASDNPREARKSRQAAASQEEEEQAEAAAEPDTSVQLTSTLVDVPPATLAAHLADDKLHFKRQKKLTLPVPDDLVAIDRLLADWAEARRVNPPAGWCKWSAVLMAQQTMLLFNGFAHRLVLSDVEMLQAGLTLERLKYAQDEWEWAQKKAASAQQKKAQLSGSVVKEAVLSEWTKRHAPKKGYQKPSECDQRIAPVDLTPFHPPMHLVRLIVMAPTLFRTAGLVTGDAIARRIVQTYWADLLQYIESRAEELLSDPRYYSSVTKEDLDFVAADEVVVIGERGKVLSVAELEKLIEDVAADEEDEEEEEEEDFEEGEELDEDVDSDDDLDDEEDEEEEEEEEEDEEEERISRGERNAKLYRSKLTACRKMVEKEKTMEIKELKKAKKLEKAKKQEISMMEQEVNDEKNKQKDEKILTVEQDKDANNAGKQEATNKPVTIETEKAAKVETVADQTTSKTDTTGEKVKEQNVKAQEGGEQANVASTSSGKEKADSKKVKSKKEPVRNELASNSGEESDGLEAAEMARRAAASGEGSDSPNIDDRLTRPTRQLQMLQAEAHEPRVIFPAPAMEEILLPDDDRIFDFPVRIPPVVLQQQLQNQLQNQPPNPQQEQEANDFLLAARLQAEQRAADDLQAAELVNHFAMYANFH